MHFGARIPATNSASAGCRPVSDGGGSGASVIAPCRGAAECSSGIDYIRPTWMN